MNQTPFDAGVMPSWAYTIVWVVGVVAVLVLAAVITVMVRDRKRGRRR